MEKENITHLWPEVKIEFDEAEEPDEGLIHCVFSSGCQGSTATREQHTLSHQLHSDALCDIKAEPTTHETVRHLLTGESVMAEPAAPDAPQHGACENIKAEPTDHQTAQHAACENVKAEPGVQQTAQNRLYENIKADPTAHGAEDSEEWRDVGNFTVTLVPVAYTWASGLLQENQASSPCPVRQKGKDVTDCCEAEAANEKKQARSVPVNSQCESRHRPSPHSTAALLSHGDTGPTPVPEVRVDIPHRCQLCPSAFVLYTNLKAHMAAIHHQKLLTQHSQPSPPDRGRGRPSAGNSEQKVGCLVCDVCSEVFSWASHLKKHKLTHMGEKPFVCDVCSKGFTQAFSLKMHKRVHTGETPFVCDVCSRGFTVSYQLKLHKLKHTGEKPFMCDVCGTCFTQTSQLKKHKLIHTGEKPFVCDVCSKGFTASFNLKRHKLVHTGQKPFECDVCSKAFGLAGNLKTHKLIHTKSDSVSV